jgi:hypothetical protein
LARYSHLNNDPKTTFKKTVKNIRAIEEGQKQEREHQKYQTLMHNRAETAERYNNRKLERLVTQYSCSQGLSKEQVDLITKLEQEDPVAFDELLGRKKWTSIVKNTDKAIADQNMNHNYWNLLNHMP